MEGIPNFPMPLLICRACLRIVENKTQSFGFIDDSGNLKDMIMCCIPEMDIHVSSNPLMCFPCIQLLVTVYNFKTRCLNTESILSSYIQRNNLTEYNHVNLSCVIQELINGNSYFRDGQHNRIEPQRPIRENSCNQNTVLYQTPLGALVSNLTGPQNNGAPVYHVAHVNQNIARNHPIIRNENATNGPEPSMGYRFIPTDQATAVEQRTPPPGVVHNQPERVLIERGVIESAEEFQKMLNKQIAENQNIENRQTVTENLPRVDTNSEKMETNSCETKQGTDKDREIDKDSTNSSDCTKDTYKAVVPILESNNNSSLSKDELPKSFSSENRPRLIIRICKNKITLPPDKNEDSNEKENKKLDTEVNKIETPPPPSSPFDIHHSEDNDEQKIYECLNCTFITTQPNCYKVHTNTCFSTDLSEKKCPHCPHVTNRLNALNKHINTKHTRHVWYTCEHCNYRSTDSSCLRRHQRNLHPEEVSSVELTCHLCKYRCSTNYNLTKHMRKHDINSMLHCEFCSYSTRDRSNFRKHVFIHNPKPQNCEFCNYKCVSPYQMKLHLKKMHHGVGMEDVDCRSEVSITQVVEDISAAIEEAKGSGEPQKE